MFVFHDKLHRPLKIPELLSIQICLPENYFRFEGQGNYKRKLLADICYPLSNLDLSPELPTFPQEPRVQLVCSNGELCLSKLICHALPNADKASLC